MKKVTGSIFTLLLVTILTACANGGQSSVAPPSSSSPTSEPTSQPTSAPTSATSQSTSSSSQPTSQSSSVPSSSSSSSTAPIVISYTVAFNGNGGTLVSGNELQKVTSPAEIVAPIYEREGFSFSGWDKDLSTISTDAIVKAQWNINTYKVVFDSRGGSAIAEQDVPYLGNATKPEDPIRSGFAFLGWYSDPELSISFNFYKPITENTTVYAKWNEYFTVEFDSNGGTAVAPITVQSGEKISKPDDPVKFSYTFTNWYSDQELTTPFDFNSVITSNFTLYAGWEINYYVVSFDSSEGSFINSQVVKHGETATKPVDPTRFGYTFLKWSYGGNEFDFENTPITESIELVAVWEITNYKITYNLNGGKNHSTNPSTYTIFDEITFKDASKDHYEFTGWYSGDVKVTGIELGSTGDITIEARYVIAKHYVVLHSDETMGTTTGGGLYEYGAKVSLNVSPEKGYKFEGWYSDAEYKKIVSAYADLSFYFYKDEDYHLYAKFSPISYTISYNMNGGTNNPGNPSTYLVTDEITLLDPTKDENTFAGWKLGDNFVTKIPAGTTGNLTLEAKWTANQYQVVATVKDSTLGSVTGAGYYDYDAEVTLTAVPQDGYKVKGWYADDQYTELLSIKTNYTFANAVGGKHVYIEFWTEAENQVRWNNEHGVTPVIDTTAKTLTYGYYPQDRVIDPSAGLIAEAQKHSEEEIFLYDEEYFVRNTANKYGNTTFKDGTQIVNGQTYYFKCAPITWSIHSDLASNRYIVDSKDVLNAHTFGESNNYNTTGGLKDYLNNTFYNGAFAFDKSKIEQTTLTDFEINCNVFAISKDQFSWYYSVTKDATDFARSNNCHVVSNISSFWSRTADTSIMSNYYVWAIKPGDGGSASFHCNSGSVGVSPAFTFINE